MRSNFQLKCCGKDGPLDYKTELRNTCCGKVRMKDHENCKNSNLTAFETGCYKAHEHNLQKKFVLFAIVYNLIAIVAALTSMCSFLLREETKFLISKIGH